MVRGACAAAGVGDARLLGSAARALVLGFAVLTALDELRVAPTAVGAVWTASTHFLALAGGLAFGLGGRHVARRLVEALYVRLAGAQATGLRPSDLAAAHGWGGGTAMRWPRGAAARRTMRAMRWKRRQPTLRGRG